MIWITRAALFKDRIALDDLTYGELDRRSRTIAAGILAKLGVDDLAGARVPFLAQPGWEYVATQWAIWLAGGLAVPMCTSHPPAEWQYVLEDSKAALWIKGSEFIDATAICGCEQASVPELFMSGEFAPKRRADRENAGTRELGAGEDRPALMLYTSGTTGRPKGVVITHAQLRSQIETLVESWAWTENDRTIHVLPLHHTHGIVNVLCCALYSGAQLEMMAKFDAAVVFERLASGELTLFMAVPTIYTKLIQYFDSISESEKKRLSAGLKKLRLMVSGSAALPVSVFERWAEISGHRLLERYGMTEIGMALSNPLVGERRPGTVGLPLPRVQVRQVDGELWVAGPSVFKEYWNRADATRDSFVVEDGVRWFKTGDVAAREEDNGYYRLLGRTSVDIIKTGGYKVSALEIEERLREHALVKDCAVVALPDEEWGERVAAAVVLNAVSNATSSTSSEAFTALQAFARENLAKYKVPTRWLAVTDLPRNAMGKVLKQDVKKLF